MHEPLTTRAKKKSRKQKNVDSQTPTFDLQRAYYALLQGYTRSLVAPKEMHHALPRKDVP